MAIKVPPELKKITQFIRRAEELDNDKSNPESRVVAYYCRQHAVVTGIPLASSSPAAKKCLGEILGSLEGEKAAMSVFTKDESKLICRKFADKIFEKADQEDRFGAANKNTARTFYAAATFYEILTQFYDSQPGPETDGEDDPDQVEEERKRIYSKWKATEILKAIKEGRQPTPGAYGEGLTEEDEGDDAKVDTGVDTGVGGGDDGGNGGNEVPSMQVGPPSPVVDMGDVSLPAAPPTLELVPDEEGTEVGLTGPPPAYPGGEDDNSSDDGGDVFVPGPMKSAASGMNGLVGQQNGTVDHQPPVPPPAYEPPAPAPAPKPARQRSPKTPAVSNMFGFGRKTSSSKVSKAALQDATELTRFALSALQDKDADLAATRLQQALEALGR